MTMLTRAVVLVALCSALTSCSFRRLPPNQSVPPPEDPVIGGDVNLPPGGPAEPCGSNRPRDCLRDVSEARLPRHPDPSETDSQRRQTFASESPEVGSLRARS